MEHSGTGPDSQGHAEAASWRTMGPELIPSTLRPTFVEHFNCSLALDLGCGHHPVPAKSPLVAADLNFDALTTSRFEAVKVCCNAIHLPFRANAFDCIFLVAVLSLIVNFADRARSLQEARRVLGRNGHLVVVDFLENRDDSYFSSRYGQVDGHAYGTFRVERGEAASYLAHHFRASDLLTELSEVGLTPVRTLSRTVHTRTGRSTYGVEIHCMCC